MQPLNAPSHVAPTAPSTTRWSAESVTFIMVAVRQPAPLLPSATTRFSAAPTARMPACGVLTIAANWRTPKLPRLEMVKVPPWYSSGASFPARAFSTSDLTLLRGVRYFAACVGA